MSNNDFKIIFTPSNPPKFDNNDIGILRRIKIPKYICLKGCRQQRIPFINKKEKNNE